MIIHTAWVGPDPIPETFKLNMQTQSQWASFNGRPQHSPGFTWRCWTEEQVRGLPMLAWVLDTPFYKSCMAAKHYAAACDMLRYVLLWHFGGLWCDADVEVLRDPERLFDNGSLRSDLHCAWEDPDLLGMAVVYAPPHHPVIGALVEWYKQATYADITEGGGNENGPQIFTRFVSKATELNAHVVIHDAEVFYPSNWRTPDQVNITDKTITWHKWAASWKQTADLSKWRYR